ncbi:MAG: hypothetical protein QOD68_1853, partial [Actinomycetota bacterium]|nr:hypothetical protein [Actinomycetota bacterium]
MSEPSGTRYAITGRAVTAAVLGLLMATLAWLTGNAWFLLLSGAFAGALVVGVFTRGRLDGLAVEVTHPPRVAVGTALHTVLTVTNKGRRVSSEATFSLYTAGIAELVASVGRLRPGEHVAVPVTRLATGRAVADRTLVHLLSRPGLGLTGTTRPLHVPDHVTVHPRLHDMRDLPVGSKVGDGTDASVVTGQGSEVLDYALAIVQGTRADVRV